MQMIPLEDPDALSRMFDLKTACDLLVRRGQALNAELASIFILALCIILTYSRTGQKQLIGRGFES